MSERIAKFIARSGVCSRRAAEELIMQQRVTVNGEKVDGNFVCECKMTDDTNIVVVMG